MSQGEPLTDQGLEKTRADTLNAMRTEVTILFSDIKGSTPYFERKGDAEGLAMVQHHNALLFPIIESAGGRVVKTIGDAIMACFKDPVRAVRAAIQMQQALEEDRLNTEVEEDRIHIRVALHKGFGIEKDNDFFGDVVNAAAKIQQQANPDQILITDALLDAARQAGAQCAKLGRAQIKGKDEALDVYAVAWSEEASEQLVEELQQQYEARLKESRRQKELLEEELESSREQWRGERRRLVSEIEELEAELERANESSGQETSEELHAQIRFQLDEAIHAKQQVEQELVAAEARWDIERKRLKAQIDSLHGAALVAMEHTNNPARLALAVREQVEVRLKDARADWQLQWEGERRRLNSEIERLKNMGNVDEKKEATRRAVLQKMGKLASSGGGRSYDESRGEFDAAKKQWDLEREQLTLKVRQLERQGHYDKDATRQEVFHELRGQYESKMEAYEHQCRRLRDDLEALQLQHADERQRLTDRIEHLEHAIPEAQEAVRVQMEAELKVEFQSQLDEINRMKARNERRALDAHEESQAALRRAQKEVARLQTELQEAREAAFRVQRSQSSS